ncbi:hypothetical protein ACVIWU_006426 [Bradyrhizobium sp. USDA 4509]
MRTAISLIAIRLLINALLYVMLTRVDELSDPDRKIIPRIWRSVPMARGERPLFRYLAAKDLTVLSDTWSCRHRPVCLAPIVGKRTSSCTPERLKLAAL